jgi:hypothetical protein
MKETKNNENGLSIDSQLRLASILNDTTTKVHLGGRIFEIRALRAGTQYLIAEEAARIAKSGEDFSDIVKRFAEDVPRVVRCITLAVLNDKEKIQSREYQDMYDFIMYETDPKEWLPLLMQVLQMLDLSFFFAILPQIDLFRQMTLMKKTQIEAQSSELQAK